MFEIWSEIKVPSEYAPLLAGVARFARGSFEAAHSPWEALADADAILAGGKIQYDARLMGQGPKLKVITRIGIGYDNVDVHAATARGIAVCITPEAPTRSTAEHAITMLLAVAKDLHSVRRQLDRGESKDYFVANRGIEVEGRTLGLVGLGRIGGLVAPMGAAMGMKVIGFDPVVSPQRALELGVEARPTLEAVLSEADFVSLHAPLTSKTRELLGVTKLSLMKKGSYLINCARGGLVDEAALLEALKSGHLAGAAIDVWEQEPPAPDHPLLALDNVIATPHIASGTVAGKDRLWRSAIEESLRILRGEAPLNRVN